MSVRGRRPHFCYALCAGWAALLGPFAQPALAQQSASGLPPLDPESPLEPLPDLGVPWPDLQAEEPPIVMQPEIPVPGVDVTTLAEAAGAESPDETITPVVVVANGPQRYEIVTKGLENLGYPLFQDRFEALSTLEANVDKPANVAQIDRRTQDDAELVTEILRAGGWYDARAEGQLEPSPQAGHVRAVISVRPGQRYLLSDVSLPGLDATGPDEKALRTQFPVQRGDPVDADAIVTARLGLITALGEGGYPFAKVEEPDVTIDHADQTGTLTVPVDAGGKYVFGRLVARDGDVFSSDHLQDIARFQPGDPFRQSKLVDLRRALIATGLVSAVDLKPVPAGAGEPAGRVDIVTNLERAPPRTIAGEAGYGTGEGARMEVSWQHRNFFPPEGALTVRGVLGTREQSMGLIFRRNNFEERDQVLNGQLVASHVDRAAYDARTFQLSGNIERQTTIFFQKKWVWSVGGELVASDERDVLLETGEPRRRTFFIAALPSSLTYDGTDDLLDPHRGFRLGGRISPELSFQSGTFGYTRFQLDASAYQPVADQVVMAGRIRLGTIAGARRDEIAPSRRFYAGGGGSVRGYGYQAIGPRDPNNDPIGGRSLAEFALEARVRIGNFGIVPFLDGGNIYTSYLPKVGHFRYGTGVGVRYYSNFGPIRVDVGTPINPQPGDARVAVYVSLGQAF